MAEFALNNNCYNYVSIENNFTQREIMIETNFIKWR